MISLLRRKSLSANKSVVIIAPPCGNIEQSVARAFNSLDWHARVLTYGDICPRHLFERAIFSLSPASRQAAIHRDFNSVIRTELLPLVAHDKPDFILVLKGHRLDEPNKRALQQLDLPLVTWAYDSLARCPEMADIIDLSVHTFYIDGGDVPRGAVNASWLPLGYDDSIFTPDLCQVPELDVLFIGSLGKLYARRRRFLKMLADSSLARDYRIAFIGSTGKRITDARLKLNPAVEWIGKRVSVDALAHNIAKAKICINIHQDDGIKPVNPMFFAIAGAGTCQMVENRNHFSEWLRPGIDYVEFEDADFIAVLSAMLTDEVARANIAAAGLAQVRANHSYVQRVRQICKQTMGAE